MAVSTHYRRALRWKKLHLILNYHYSIWFVAIIITPVCSVDVLFSSLSLCLAGRILNGRSPALTTFHCCWKRNFHLVSIINVYTYMYFFTITKLLILNWKHCILFRHGRFSIQWSSLAARSAGCSVRCTLNAIKLLLTKICDWCIYNL
jgi:hypothetical protein